MSRSTGFAARSLVSTLMFGGGLGMLLLAGGRPTVPVAGVVSVAIVAGVMLETIRWQRGRFDARMSHGQVQRVAGVAALIWMAGLWIDLLSSDRGALVIGGTIAAAAVIYTYSFLPHHRGI